MHQKDYVGEKEMKIKLKEKKEKGRQDGREVMEDVVEN